MIAINNIVPPLDLTNAANNKVVTYEDDSASVNFEDQCKQLKEENKILSQKLKMSEQEVQLQKQSLSNLALTVVQQNRQMKMLAQQIFNMTKAALAAQESQSSDEGTVSQENSYFAEFINNPANIIAIKEDMSSPDDVLNGLNAVSPSPCAATDSTTSADKKSSGTSTPYSQKSYGSSQSGLQPQNCRMASPLGGFLPKHFRRSSTLNSVNVPIPIQDHPIMLNRSKSEHVRPKSRSKTPVRFNLDEYFEEDDLKKFHQSTEKIESNTPRSNQLNRNGGVTFRERGEKVRCNGKQNERQFSQDVENGLVTPRRRNLIENNQDLQFPQNENSQDYTEQNNFARRDLGRSKTAHFEDSKYVHKSCRNFNRSKTAHFEDSESMYEQEYVQSRRSTTPRHNKNSNANLDLNRVNKVHEHEVHFEDQQEYFQGRRSTTPRHNPNLNLNLDTNRVNKFHNHEARFEDQTYQQEYVQGRRSTTPRYNPNLNLNLGINRVTENDHHEVHFKDEEDQYETRRQFNRSKTTQFSDQIIFDRERGDCFQSKMCTPRRNTKRCKSTCFDERRSDDYFQNGMITSRRNLRRSKTPHFEERRSNDYFQNGKVTSRRSMNRPSTAVPFQVEFVKEVQFEDGRQQNKSHQQFDQICEDVYYVDEAYHNNKEAYYDERACEKRVSTPRRRIKRSTTTPINHVFQVENEGGQSRGLNRQFGRSLDQFRGQRFEDDIQQGGRNSRQQLKNISYEFSEEEEVGIDIAFLNDKIAALEQMQQDQGELEIQTDVNNN